MRLSTIGCWVAALGSVVLVGCGGSEEYKAREATKTARDAKVQERLAAREQQKASQDQARAAADETAWRNSAAGKVQQKHPEWSRHVCDAVAVRSVFVGMTPAQAEAAWGKPKSRRISDEHRMVYRVAGNNPKIAQLRFPYAN